MFGNKDKKKEVVQATGTEQAKEQENREAAQKAGSAEPVEQALNIPGELVGGADRLAAAADAGTMQEQLDALKAMIARQQDIISDMLANQKRIETNTGQEGKDLLRPKKRAICSHCSQYVSICGGTPEAHVTMRVLPESHENYQGFPGVGINGVWYKGICVVPRVCADTIKGTIRNFEDYRTNLRHNRGKILGLQRDIMLAEMQRPGGYEVFK